MPISQRVRSIIAGLRGASERAISSTADFERQLVRGMHKRRIPSLRQLRHSYRIFTSTERVILSACAVVMVASMVWVGIGQALAHLDTEPTAGGSYTEAMVGQPHYVNPVLSGDSLVDSDLTRLIFAGLFRYDAALQLQPDLAESVQVSDDRRTYTIKLRPDLHWHDGYPITAEDIVFTFEKIADAAVKSPLRPNFKGVAVEQIDGATVRFTLEQPYAAFLDTLTAGIIPQHIWRDVAPAEWRGHSENLRPVGSGPWSFESITRNTDGSVNSFTLGHADIASWRPAAPYLERLIFKFYPDDVQAVSALKTQSVQGLAFLTSTEREDLQRNKRLTFYELPVQGITAVFFNLNQSSPVQDLAVRRALRAAIDHPTLVNEVLKSEQAATPTLLPASVLNDVAAVSKARGSDVDADALLTQAGWQRIGAIRQNKRGETLDITLTVLDREPDRKIGQFIQAQWRSLGVETRIDLISATTAADVERIVLRPRAYQALLTTIVYGAHVDPYPFWHSSQRIDPGLNLSLLSDHDVDEMIEQGRRAASPEAERTAYQKLAEWLAKEAVAIPLIVPSRLYAVDSTIQGVTAGTVATPADRFNSLNEWFVKTKKKLAW